jgi:hypothetical protein
MIELSRAVQASQVKNRPRVIRVNHDSIDETLAEVYLGRARRINCEGVRSRAPDDVLADEVNPPRTLLALASRAVLRKTDESPLLLWAQRPH